MMQPYDIRTFFHVEDYESFRQTILHMAVNHPEQCMCLLNSLPNSYYFKPSRFYRPQSERSFRSADNLMGSFRSIIGLPVSSSSTKDDAESSRSTRWEQMVEQFVYDCGRINQDQRIGGEEEKEIERALSRLYGNSAAQAIRYLLDHVSEETIQKFAYTFLDPGELARRASVDIIVRPIANEKDMHGNIGQYLIYTFKEEGDEQLLHFTNQPSCVYYLMYLIDRCHHEELFMSSIDLAANLDSFVELYHKVYDITSDALNERVRRLLYREDAAGMIRVGRERECINDIRKHLEEAFTSYGESYFPYAMTANRHLSVSPQKIIFEGKASELLNIQFT